MIVATSNSIPEGSCKRQLRLYLDHLKNGTLWATEMFDSSAKYPYGLFGGLTRYLGSFDQCERIQAKIINNENGEIEEIISRYCLVDVKFKEKNEPTKFIGEHNIYFDPQVSAWEAIREKGDFRRFPRYLLQMALCFPAKCQIEDIVVSLKKPLDEFSTKYNISVDASISPMYCSKEATEFSIYDKIFCLTFLLILTVVILSTIIDKNSDENEELSLITCFSARRNFNKIFRVNYQHPGFDIIHSLRAIFACLTILGHRQIQNMYAGTISGQYYEWILSTSTFGIMHNGAVLMDGFLGLGGLLLSFSLLEYWNISKKFNFIFLILKRLVRILPLYMFITFAYAIVFHRLGSGPYWEASVGADRDSCSSYWWTNLFFVNNYFGGNNKCVIQSWYLSVDVQCYIIGLLLMRGFYKMPRKIGYIFLGFTLIVSSAVLFHFTYKHDLDPVLKNFANIRRIEDTEYFLNYYSKTEFRLGGYVTGLIIGCFIYDYKNSKWRLSKAWSQILFILVFGVIFTTTWMGTLFMNPNLKVTAFERALYASLHRPIIAIGICTIPLLFTIADGLDYYYNILAARWFQPLSRLSFAMYLTHFLIHHYEIGTTKTAFPFSFYSAFKYWAGDIVYSMCLALFVVLIIELPINNFINIILKRKTNLMIRIPSPNTQKKTKEY
ncbi:O-acyltransferase like protein-like isoform X2 [Leptopilina boulardi]|nr:O-acyltransferase like protein-like isoform X2 [Leptopilina boulardi]